MQSKNQKRKKALEDWKKILIFWQSRLENPPSEFKTDTKIAIAKMNNAIREIEILKSRIF